MEPKSNPKPPQSALEQLPTSTKTTTTKQQNKRIMVVRIRLQRLGRRNLPFFRIVVADSRARRDGRFIENVSHSYYCLLVANDRDKQTWHVHSDILFSLLHMTIISCSLGWNIQPNSHKRQYQRNHCWFWTCTILDSKWCTTIWSCCLAFWCIRYITTSCYASINQISYTQIIAEKRKNITPFRVSFNISSL